MKDENEPTISIQEAARWLAKFSCDNSPEAFHLQISEYLKQ